MQRKKTSWLIASFLGLFAAAFIFSTVWAQDQEQLKGEGNAASERSVGNRQDGKANGSTAKEIPKPGKNGKNNKGQANAADHRSAVAAFVENLLSVADQEGRIGLQVREVAEAQNESKEKEAAEIEAVKSRSRIKTFFVGTDYKNLGALRSDMVKTGNRIDQLKRLAGRAENPDNKLRLESQIEALSIEQANIQKFIADNESQFSLFGWAVKLFQ